MNVDVPTNVGASPLILIPPLRYLLSLEMGVAIPICIMRYYKTRFEGCDITIKTYFIVKTKTKKGRP